MFNLSLKLIVNLSFEVTFILLSYYIMCIFYGSPSLVI